MIDVAPGYYDFDEMPVHVMGEGAAVQCNQWSSGRPKGFAIERV